MIALVCTLDDGDVTVAHNVIFDGRTLTADMPHASWEWTFSKNEGIRLEAGYIALADNGDSIELAAGPFAPTNHVRTRWALTAL